LSVCLFVFQHHASTTNTSLGNAIKHWHSLDGVMWK